MPGWRLRHETTKKNPETETAETVETSQKEKTLGKMTYWVAPDWAEESQDISSGVSGTVYQLMSGGDPVMMIVAQDTANSNLTDTEEAMQIIADAMVDGSSIQKISDGVWGMTLNNGDNGQIVGRLYAEDDAVYSAMTQIPPSNADAQKLWETFVKYIRVG